MAAFARADLADLAPPAIGDVVSIIKNEEPGRLTAIGVRPSAAPTSDGAGSAVDTTTPDVPAPTSDARTGSPSSRVPVRVHSGAGGHGAGICF